MTKTIVITSGKGGVGKTSISVNIAVELAGRGLRTCLFDADLGLANVNILFGIQPEATIDDVLFGEASFAEVTVGTEFGVDVIPGSSGVEKMANLDEARLSGLVERFDGLAGYDYFLIDTASGISRGVISFCLASAETILVLTAEATSLADAYAVLKVLSLNNYRGTVKVLVNRCASIPQAKKTYLHFKSVADRHLRINIAPGGAVLSDPSVAKAVSLQYPAVALSFESVFAQCIRAVVTNLLRTEPDGPTEGDDGFWHRYARFARSELLLPGESNRSASSAPESGKPQPGTESQGDPEEGQTLVRPNLGGQSRPELTDGRSLCGLFAPGRLPGPAPLFAHVLKLGCHGRLSPAEMEKIVAHEPVLLGRILHVHSQGRPPGDYRTPSIGQVLEDLGEDSVRRFLLTTACHNLLLADSFREYATVNEHWRHSCRCGLLAESLAAEIGYPFPYEAYIAGMLHDIGRLALQAHAPEIYADTASPLSHDAKTLGAERQVAGMAHDELGAEILSDWRLHSFIVDAARYHGETKERAATGLDLTRLIYLAHRLSGSAGEKADEAVELARQLFGLASSQVFAAMQEASRRLADIAAVYDIPFRQELEEQAVLERLRHYRRQAVEFVALQASMPRPWQPDTGGDGVRLVCRGLHLLFGINRALVLLPDRRRLQLRAAGYPQGYGQEFVDNVCFSLSSRESLVVAAYRSGRFRVLAAAELSSMADRQLLGLMRSEMLACLPVPPAETGSGLIVCGMRSSEYLHFQTLQGKLEMFAAQAAANLCCS